VYRRLTVIGGRRSYRCRRTSEWYPLSAIGAFNELSRLHVPPDRKARGCITKQPGKLTVLEATVSHSNVPGLINRDRAQQRYCESGEESPMLETVGVSSECGPHYPAHPQAASSPPSGDTSDYGRKFERSGTLEIPGNRVCVFQVEGMQCRRHWLR